MFIMSHVSPHKQVHEIELRFVREIYNKLCLSKFVNPSTFHEGTVGLHGISQKRVSYKTWTYPDAICWKEIGTN